MIQGRMPTPEPAGSCQHIFGSDCSCHGREIRSALDSARRERDEWQEAHHVAVRRAETAEDERNVAMLELGAAVVHIRLQAEHIKASGRCSSCQTTLPISELPKHVSTCEKHPMAALTRERDALKAEVAELRRLAYGNR